jgi:hypothetical protein
VSRANRTTNDQSKLPIIVRVGLCGHHRRRKGSAQPASAPRRATRKAERRTSRRSGL